ncbi:MAG: LacI family DNA-binding transcriptional regulator [Christensenellales bacterium]|jgi:DNA-binding LacI/PurR family transcriptional regulator
MASIKDVARLANVSISTVSLAYNQPARVLAHTRAAIFDAAKQLGYSPSNRAAAMPRQKSVMMLLPDMRETHVPSVQGVQDTCITLGLNLLPLVCPAMQVGRMYAALEHAIEQRRVAGIIVAGDGVPSLVRAADENGVPMVFMMRPFTEPNRAEIVINNRKVGMDMAGHLIRNGYTSIAVVGGPAGHHRIEGLEEALGQQGITIYNENGWMDAAIQIDDCAGAYAFISNVLSTQQNLPDAIFCITDMIALGVLSALQSYELRVPGDIAVAGCEDIHISRITEPQLTSVEFPRYEQGVQAALLINRMINGRPAEQILLDCKLVERASTRRR